MKLLERRRNLIGAFARFVLKILGKPPLTLEACVNDKSTIDYKLYGESVQDGTPTPDAPVEVESVGEKTVNLFDPTVQVQMSTNKDYKGLDMRTWEGTYALKINLRDGKEIPTGVYFGVIYNNTNAIWLISNGKINSAYDCFSNFGTDFSALKNGVVCYPSKRLNEVVDAFDIMLVKGRYTRDTMPNYEPYGKYKIPIKVNNGKEEITTNIYLDEPLRKIGDYADYIDFENQVVVRNTGCHTFEGTEEISIPGSVIEGYTPFRHMNIYTARQPFVCNYLPFLAKDYLHAVSECLAKYSTGGQMFFVISNDRIPLNDITSFKSWLINLKDNGNPLKVYYKLSSYVEEPIELPQLPTFKGTTIYSVDTNIQPSNMEVTYYSKERSVL